MRLRPVMSLRPGCPKPPLSAVVDFASRIIVRGYLLEVDIGAILRESHLDGDVRATRTTRLP
jgi:hypothetical protein